MTSTMSAASLRWISRVSASKPNRIIIASFLGLTSGSPEKAESKQAGRLGSVGGKQDSLIGTGGAMDPMPAKVEMGSLLIGGLVSGNNGSSGLKSSLCRCLKATKSRVVAMIRVAGKSRDITCGEIIGNQVG